MPRNKSNRVRLIIILTMTMILAIAGLTLLSSTEVTAGGTTLVGSSDKSVAQTDVTKAPLSSMSGLQSIGKMVSALVIVIICIYGAIYLLKRMTTSRRSSQGQSELLEVLQSAHLGPKKMISVVRVADRSVLVGVTDNQITLLSEMDEAQTAEILKAEVESSPSPKFSEILRSVSAKVKELGTRKVQTVLEVQAD